MDNIVDVIFNILHRDYAKLSLGEIAENIARLFEQKKELVVFSNKIKYDDTYNFQDVNQRYRELKLKKGDIVKIIVIKKN
jgi:uncharacterized protein YecE (DUF72 family)